MTEIKDTVALAGNPNAGKTTIFNALTGSNQRVGNYAGVTIEKKSGEFFTPHGRKVRVIDLPGCYALNAESLDQQIAARVLLGQDSLEPPPSWIINVVDASALERHLMLTLELMELGRPMVLALNMIDVAENQGIRLDPRLLSEQLGIAVVPMQASHGKGLIELKQSVRHPLPLPPESKWLRPGMSDEEKREARLRFIHETCLLAARRPDAAQVALSDQLDRFFLHPIGGWLALLVAMFVLFWTIFRFSEIPMGWLEFAQEWLQSVVSNSMAPGDLNDLLTQGIIGGVGSVLVFLPQIVLLFFLIGLLESSGYMARAAFMMDGLMSRVGLSGKAFLPLLSSYACAIPGILATRTIDSAKERLVTIFVAPWMSCSARLPVYLLLVPLLLHEKEGGSMRQALVMTALYATGTVTAFLVAKVLRKKLGPDERKHHFMIELPPFRRPQWNYILRHVCDRAWAFVKNAGTIILAISIILWALQTYPKSESDDPAERLSHSMMGRISRVIEPIFRPLGHDGKTGAAILTSFAAREVFVSSMAIVHHVEEAEDENLARASLRDTLQDTAWPDGRPMFTTASLISLLLFYIYALQCLPTSAVVARETGSWKWAVSQFLFMTAFAWLTACLAYQIGIRIP
jgi:ferrous iron transport protein B